MPKLGFCIFSLSQVNTIAATGSHSWLVELLTANTHCLSDTCGPTMLRNRPRSSHRGVDITFDPPYISLDLLEAIFPRLENQKYKDLVQDGGVLSLHPTNQDVILQISFSSLARSRRCCPNTHWSIQLRLFWQLSALPEPLGRMCEYLELFNSEYG